MRHKKQNSPSLAGGAGSLNMMNLLGSVFTVNAVYDILLRLVKSLVGVRFCKTPCITIGFCAVLLILFGFLGVSDA